METDDDLRPFGEDGKFSPVAAVKMTAKIVALLPAMVAAFIAVISSIHAYQAASADAKARAQKTKDLSEAGFQVTKHAVEELQARVQVLERAAKRAEDESARQVKARRSPRRSPVVPLAPIPVVVSRAKALPSNLDTAKAVVYPQQPAREPRDASQ